MISQDFLDSPFCIEELGVGWFLAQQKKRTCFYLLLPDVAPDDMRGLINKSIQQFLLLDLKDHKQFDQFAQDILNFFIIKHPNIATISRIKENFFTAIEPQCKKLIDTKEHCNNEKAATQSLRIEFDTLKKEYEDQKTTFHNKIVESTSASAQEKLLVELKTIERLLDNIGSVYGISKDVFPKISKTFWFNSIHRYKELLELTGSSPSNYTVELLAATLFAIDGDFEIAKKHILCSVKLCTARDVSLHKYMLTNFFEVYKDSMADAIQILKNKLPSCKAGITKDSYVSVIHFLENREKTLNDIQGEDPSQP